MSQGTAVRPITKREKKVHAVLHDLAAHLGYGPDEWVDRMATVSENKFLCRLKKRWPGSEWFRSGWPDYLIRTAKGEMVGVEVKSAYDRLLPSQKRLFAVLETMGFRVYVWHEPTPDRLIPWRAFASMKRGTQKRRASSELG